MADFPTWDFATDFTGVQSASLIAGVDPSQYATERERVAPVLDRIKRSYELARGYYRDMYLADPSDIAPDLPRDALESLNMRRKLEHVNNHAGEVRFAEWLSDDVSDFEQQRFTREQLTDWLGAARLTSVYTFTPSASIAEPSKLEKSLDTKERKTLLTIIGVLCTEAKIPLESHSKAAGYIHSTAAKMGVSIGETTIEGHLKKVREALGARMK